MKLVSCDAEVAENIVVGSVMDVDEEQSIPLVNDEGEIICDT